MWLRESDKEAHVGNYHLQLSATSLASNTWERRAGIVFFNITKLQQVQDLTSAIPKHYLYNDLLNTFV